MEIEFNQNCERCEHNAVCRFTVLGNEIATKVNNSLEEIESSLSDNFSVNLSCHNFRFKRGER